MNNHAKSYSFQQPNTDTSILSPVLAYIKTAMRRLAKWRKNARARRELEEISTHILKDIGVSESRRDREISKPFWVD